jgi:oxygen-independent coproporphyrinogen III oxidase
MAEMPSTEKTNAGGIYVHVPFCTKKCPYCDFFSIPDLTLIPDYVESIVREIRMAPAPSLVFDSIYFGGGTPSLLETDQLCSIIGEILERFDILPDTEITLEANPGTVSAQNLRAYRDMGVNRITIGVQSLFDHNLKFLGRSHVSEEAQQAVYLARQYGFDNIGLDLMYGLPGQSINAWLEDLSRAVFLNPEHLSCYLLTYEKGTRLDVQRRRGRIVPLDDDHAGDLFTATWEFLAAHGYEGYEVSNFARTKGACRETAKPPPNRSRHNQKYWSGAPYLGFGPAAHSYIAPSRYWNVRSVDRYIRWIREGRPPIEGKECLTVEQQMIEAVYLGLRTSEGIDVRLFDNRFGRSFLRLFDGLVTRLEGECLVLTTEERCKLTLKGMLVLEAVGARFAEII